MRLSPVPDRSDQDLVPAHGVDEDVRSSANGQFPQIGLGTSASGKGEAPENFGHGHDAGHEPLRGIWFVEGDEGANFPQPGSREGRPDDLD